MKNILKVKIENPAFFIYENKNNLASDKPMYVTHIYLGL